jgi:hypothetical protein
MTGSKLINKVALKFGTQPGMQNIEFSLTGITLFVGHINSGKSLALGEIGKCCALYNKSGNLILDSISFNAPSTTEISNSIHRWKTDPNKNEVVPDGNVVVNRISTYPGLKQREFIPLHNFDEWVKNSNFNALARNYFSLLTIRASSGIATGKNKFDYKC